MRIKCDLALVKAIAWDKGKFGGKRYKPFVIRDLRGLLKS